MPSSIQALRIGQKVHLNGIEKYKHSDVLDELVCPKIRIWKNLSKKKVAAIALHGEEAKLLDFKRKRNVMHYKVEVQTEKEPVKGWVMFPFVDEAVKETYGDEDIG